MDDKEKFSEWIKKMGYMGKIPANIGNIVNPTTAALWDQIMEKVKPRTDVQTVRRNIIIERLKRRKSATGDSSPSKSGCVQSEYYKIKELEVHDEMVKCQRAIKVMDEDVVEKAARLKRGIQSTKSTYMEIDQLKAKMKETEEKTFLLDTKLLSLEKKKLDSKKMLKTVVDLNQSVAKNDHLLSTTTEILINKCAMKINESSKNNDITITSSSLVDDNDDSLKNLLNSNNLQETTQILRKGRILNNLLNDLKHVTLSSNNEASSANADNRFSLSKLYSLHVKDSIELLKCRKSLDELKTVVEEMKLKIYTLVQSKLSNPNQMDKFREKFPLQLELVALIATINSIQNQLPIIDTNQMELNVKLTEIDEIKNDQTQKLIEIQQLFRNVNEIIDTFKQCQNKGLYDLRELRDFIDCLDLNRQLFKSANEIQLFVDNFPLEYNRQFIHNKLDTIRFHRDFASNTIPIFSIIDENFLNIATILLDSPYSYVETRFIAINKLMKWRKMIALKMATSQKKPTSSDCNQKNVQIRSGMIINDLDRLATIDRFDSLNRLFNTRVMLGASQDIKKVIDLWLEMSLFGGSLSVDRMVNGRNINYYQNMYNQIYNEMML